MYIGRMSPGLPLKTPDVSSRLADVSNVGQTSIGRLGVHLPLVRPDRQQMALGAAHDTAQLLKSPPGGVTVSDRPIAHPENGGLKVSRSRGSRNYSYSSRYNCRRGGHGVDLVSPDRAQAQSVATRVSGWP